MLSDPNVKKIMPKVGNRYESALALAKRARNIEERRVAEDDRNIKDAVDVAACEIAEGKSFVKIDGKYIIEPPVLKEEAKETQDTDSIIKE